MPHPIIARARPEIIQVNEKYTVYTSPDFLEPQAKNKRSGSIEIRVPYDGKTYVTETTVQDVKKQTRPYRGMSNVNALIGYLGFRDYEGTDLDDKYDLNLRNDLLPLYLSLNSEVLVSSQALLSDRQEQITAVHYTPPEIKQSPMSVHVDVRDEYDIVPVSKDSKDIVSFLAKWRKNVHNKVASFTPGLIFTFVLQFDVSRILRPFLAQSPPVIPSVAIKWPVATNVDRIDLIIDPPKEATELSLLTSERRRGVQYSPAEKDIRWDNIPLQPEQEGYYAKFITPPIALSIREPGELYQERTLQGTITVKLPTTYSGLKLAYFDASGEQQKTNALIKYATEIKVNFEFDLLKRLKQKAYMPYQALKFPKVILDHRRISDILTILRDKRFNVYADLESFPNEKVGKEVISFSIYADREEGDKRLTLIIDLEGTPSSTEREKQIPEGEKFKSVFPTGETTCYIYGHLYNDPQLVVQEINDIQALLKHRFRHVSILD